MKPSDIGKAYDTITHLWQSPDFNRNNGIEARKRAIAFLTNKSSALDVGCGCTGRFIALLLAEGFVPEGVDISDKMIALARERHPDIHFYQQDICEWDIPKPYDLITAWDSLWHIPLERQKAVLAKLVAALNQGGVLIFSFGATEEAGDHTDDFMGPEVYYSTLGIHGFMDHLASLGCICRHFEYDQYPELHAYLIVQKPG